MLDYNDPRWAELENADDYTAEEITDLISRLDQSPLVDGDHALWAQIWTLLSPAHRKPYSAAYAAVPHVVGFIAEHLDKAPAMYFRFPTLVELRRIEYGGRVPPFLENDYRYSLMEMAGLAGNSCSWDSYTMASRLGAIAMSKGNPQMAKLILLCETPQAIECALNCLPHA